MTEIYKILYIGDIESLELLEKMSGIRATNKNLYQSIQQKKEKNITVKPPLGVKPCYIQADERIKDLSDAISRYAGTGNYQTIRTWAKEILMQCDIVEMEKHENS